MSDLRPPAGEPPPQTAYVNGEELSLAPLADRVTELLYGEYAEQLERYGSAGREWCLHDNLYLLAWAFGEYEGVVSFREQVLWLANVLDHRGYPMDQLARDLEICADVVRDHGTAAGSEVAGILREGAVVVRDTHGRR